MFGLTETDIMAIRQVLQQFPEVQRAFVFGSRAKGNYRNGSDVDMALKGENIPYHTILQISSILNEETLMPYHFDVLNYHTIENVHLVDHINRIGKIIYQKEQQPQDQT